MQFLVRGSFLCFITILLWSSSTCLMWLTTNNVVKQDSMFVCLLVCFLLLNTILSPKLKVVFCSKKLAKAKQTQLKSARFPLNWNKGKNLNFIYRYLLLCGVTSTTLCVFLCEEWSCLFLQVKFWMCRNNDRVFFIYQDSCQPLWKTQLPRIYSEMLQ